MTFTSYLVSSTGFHPTYGICVSLEDDTHYTKKGCSLHAVHSLPPDVLVDPYELHNYYSAFTFHLTIATDLESPVFSAENRDSEVFLNFTRPGDIRNNICIDFPIHVRYGRPRNYSGYQDVIIPCPVVFWSCPATATDARSANNLKSLSFVQAFLDLNAVELFQINSSLADCRTCISVPLGDTSSLGQIHIGTVCIITLVFCYCLHKTIGAYRRMQANPQKMSKAQ